MTELLRDTLSASVGAFGGRYVAKADFTAKHRGRGVTHVVVDSCRRTLKVRAALSWEE